MKKVTKLKILKVVETFVNSVWFTTALCIVIKMFLQSLDITIKNVALYVLACWVMSMFIEIFCYHIRDIFFNDEISDEINEEERV